MKGMKGRILRKLKSIPHVGYLKQGRVLHVNASDGLLEDSSGSPPNPGRILRNLPVTREEDPESNICNPTTPSQHEIIDADELMRDLEDEEPELGSGNNKENIRPVSPPAYPASWKKKPAENSIQSKTENHNSDLDMPSFRRPDLNSDTLFDPDLLAAFEQAVMEHIRSYEEAKSRARAEEEEEEEEEEEPPSKVARKSEEDYLDPVMEFEERCPPGGMGAIVLYTTTLRGVRKTFEDCNSVRFLLGSLRLSFLERDVSMHMEFREELWRVLGGRTIPPRLFIKGRYIGGADDVLGIHEQGKLLPLVQGLPLDRSPGAACQWCAGLRFIMCSECSGGRRLYHQDNVAMHVQCNHCNENGLVPCPICC